ncbi:MAG: hypothetical protein HC853_15240 [Anaerolineae bacterium]|nr:hypothetical protein [Anaerolineae bacterium]
MSAIDRGLSESGIFVVALTPNAVRGGSWRSLQGSTRTGSRDDHIRFRLVCGSAPVS